MTNLFSDQLRLAIKQSGISCYAISKATGIDTGQLSRFMNHKAGLSMEASDAVCKLIGAKLVPGKPVKGKPKK